MYPVFDIFKGFQHAENSSIIISGKIQISACLWWDDMWLLCDCSLEPQRENGVLRGEEKDNMRREITSFMEGST